MLNLTGVPLGRNKVDDRRFYLLQCVTGLPQEGATGFPELAGTMVERQVVAVISGALRLPVTVQASEAGLHIKQSSGDVHQGAIIDQFALGAEFFNPVSYTHLRAHETDSYLVCRL